MHGGVERRQVRAERKDIGSSGIRTTFAAETGPILPRSLGDAHRKVREAHEIVEILGQHRRQLRHDQMRKEYGDDVVDDGAVAELVLLLKRRERANILEIPIEAARDEQCVAIKIGDAMWNSGKRQGAVSRRLLFVIRRKLLCLDSKNIVARKRAAAQALK